MNAGPLGSRSLLLAPFVRRFFSAVCVTWNGALNLFGEAGMKTLPKLFITAGVLFGAFGSLSANVARQPTTHIRVTSPERVQVIGEGRE